MRQLTIFDSFIHNFDQCIRTATGLQTKLMRPNPSDPVINEKLSPKETQTSASLMRINHTGEVCAQALYLAQSIATKDPAIAKQMSEAAQEEQDHLSWCKQRLTELQSRTSLLNPIWWGGSFALGLAAGFAGDKWSLGFVMETENQVSKHLEQQLNKLPEGDHKSRSIVSQMEWDERQHAVHALEVGAKQLPAPIPLMMSITSKVMKSIVYYV